MQNTDSQQFSAPSSQAEYIDNIAHMILRQTQLGADCVLSVVVPKLIAADFETRTMVFEYELTPWMRNLSGSLHGGMTSTLFDNSFGILARSLTGKMSSATTGIQVNFLKPIDIGKPVYIETRADSIGRSLACFYSFASQEPIRSKVQATATGTFFLRE